MIKKLLLFLLFPLFIFSKEYIIEYKELPKNINHKSVIKKFHRYKMIVVEGDIEEIKSLFPNANIYENKKVKATYIPNDTYFSYQWNMLENHYNLSELLDRGVLGSKSVIIGILDTGIAFEDYAIPSSEIDKVSSSDNNFHKYIDFDNINFVQGYDYVSNDSHPNDMNGHGTSITSIIASSINNNTNLAGLISNASIMPLRVLDENGEGYADDIISGIEYAIENGCNVLNLSLAGAPGDSLGWHPLHVAINDARNNNIAVVCATGNSGVNELSYPAGFPEAIAIGAVDYFKELTYYSQYGENLDFIAPGGIVHQDIDNDGYDEGGVLAPSFDISNDQADVSSISIYFIEGTSIATPHITAIIALLYSFGFNNVDDIENILIDNSEDLGDSGYDLEYGWGYPTTDLIFDFPYIMKIVQYDYLSNAFSVIINSLDTTFTIYSFYIKSAILNKKIILDNFNFTYSANINALNTGFYNLVLYYSNGVEKDSLISGIVLKSPLDTNTYIYAGEYSFYMNSSALIEIKNNGFKIIEMNDSINISFDILSNPNHYQILHDGKTINTFEYDNNKLTFNINESGYYYIVYGKDIKNEIIINNNENRNIFLMKNILQWNAGEYEMFNNIGMKIKTGNNDKINFKNLPSGIYFIKGKNQLWKVIKAF